MGKPWRSLTRQSGIQNISWNRFAFCWRVRTEKTGKKVQEYFPIRPFLQQGLGEEEAVAAALQEAKAQRKVLESAGVLKPPKLHSQQGKHSSVKGVRFRKLDSKWVLVFEDPRTKKTTFHGSFATQEDAEAKARTVAKKQGIRELEGKVVPVKKLSELKHFAPLGPQLEVKWSLGYQCWRATFQMAGKQRLKRCRPKDFSEKEVKKAWKRAVTWRKRQEKERDQATKH